MIQPLPYDEIQMWCGHLDLYMNKLEDVLKTPDDCDIGYFVEIDLKYLDNLKRKTNYFPSVPEKKVIPKDKYKDYRKKIKPNNCTEAQKLLCDKKNILVPYRMLEFFLAHGKNNG